MNGNVFTEIKSLHIHSGIVNPFDTLLERNLSLFISKKRGGRRDPRSAAHWWSPTIKVWDGNFSKIFCDRDLTKIWFLGKRSLIKNNTRRKDNGALGEARP